MFITEQNVIEKTQAGFAWDAYHEGKSVNPLNAREVVVVVDDIPIGAVTLYAWTSHLCLSSIRTFKQGLGYGSLILKEICDVADKYKVDIHITVEPFGFKTLNTKQLISWYKRYGFVKTYGRDYTRRPKWLK